MSIFPSRYFIDPFGNKSYQWRWSVSWRSEEALALCTTASPPSGSLASAAAHSTWPITYTIFITKKINLMITFWSKIFLIANPHLVLNSGSVSDLHGFYFKRILIQPKIFLLILFQSQADCFLRMKFSNVFLNCKKWPTCLFTSLYQHF